MIEYGRLEDINVALSHLRADIRVTGSRHNQVNHLASYVMSQ